MTHELAKQLKDAGFPWHTGFYGKLWQPTLSELIEACGEKFSKLIKFDNWFLQELGYLWSAEAPEPYEYEGNGETPEEAVARLWLALNKK